ncbi:MAG: hypothetical protein E7181_04915 [Erysipelotrichaceae bacterium]|nr:hypothetical protein [Erysipelotrichaceae bacterium]
MKTETKNKLDYLINLSFFLYFLILLTERIISVVLSFVNGVNIYGHGFLGYIYTLVFVSIVSFFIYLLIKCRNNIKYIFKKENGDVDYKDLCIASGILLISGMVHTEYTTPVIQFVSYGILIIGILLKVVVNVTRGGNKVLHWLSFAYLVAFSMAIPVMYRSYIEFSVLFHFLEGVASLFLTVTFTILLILVFDQNDDLFLLPTVALVIAFDVPLIVLRWSEEINYFVLIFVSLSFVLFFVGYIYKKAIKKRGKK